MAAAERGEVKTEAGGRAFWSLAASFAPLIFLLVLMAVFAALEPRFLDSTNLFNVMRQISITGLIALGMTFVILTAGIDLSVGSLLAVSAIVAAGVVKGSTGNTLSLDPDAVSGNPWYYGMAVAIAIGLAGGLLQGLGITKLKVPPFVVTLGGLSAFRGLTLWYSNGGPISGFEPDMRWWGQGQIGPVPVPVICATRAMAGTSMPWAAMWKRRACLALPSTALFCRFMWWSAFSPGSPVSCCRRG
jgi:inositol transport system permease protein